MGASISCMNYSKDYMLDIFPVVNDEKTFNIYIEYARKHKHILEIHTLLKKKGFINADNTLTTGDTPFNVFARFASGKMKNPVDQSILGNFSEDWMVCHNRPEFDRDWDDVTNNKVSMSRPDVNGPGHVFITTKNLNWKFFNVTTIVLTGNVKFLLELKKAATHYVTMRGWKKYGFYFHCFPHNTVNSLHLHVCNESDGFIGHTHQYTHYKNLPLDVAIAVASK